MFKIEKNSYGRNGACVYRDENGNSVFAKRTETGFVAKLRFSDKRIKAEPNYVVIPCKDIGFNLNVKYPSDVILSDYSGVFEDYREIVDRWAMMCFDLEIMDKKKRLGESIHDDIVRLAGYEELSGIINLLLH